LREERKNEFDSMHANFESLSNEIDERELQMQNMMNREFEHDEEL
jgi:hypothetical protein